MARSRLRTALRTVAHVVLAVAAIASLVVSAFAKDDDLPTRRGESGSAAKSTQARPADVTVMGMDGQVEVGSPPTKPAVLTAKAGVKSSGCGVVTEPMSAGSWTLAPNDAGECTLTVTAEGDGNQLEQETFDGIDKNQVVNIVFKGPGKTRFPKSSSGLFSDRYDNLKSFDAHEAVDTSGVTDMNHMFAGNMELEHLDVSGFDTSNVIHMFDMFSGCSSLKTLDVSGFNTSNVINMGSMFYGCSRLKTLDVSGFDTSSVIRMNLMFDGCSSLKALDVSGFDTSKVTTMADMFANCSRLTSLDVTGFDTSGVGDMTRMFYRCADLKTLDVTGFDTSHLNSVLLMFSGCSNLKHKWSRYMRLVSSRFLPGLSGRPASRPGYAGR